METNSQKIVKLFAEKFNLKFNGTMFSRQLGNANSLLKNYSYEEIILCINYLSLFPPKTRIVSIGYLPYIMNETLTKALYYYNNLSPEPTLEIKPNIEEVKNERKESKSMFGGNRRF